MIKFNINKYIYIFLIFIVSLASLTWFKGDFFIFGGDYLPIFHPIEEFFQDIYIWLSCDSSGLGADTRALPEIFPYELFTAFGYSLGLSVNYLQKLFFYLIISISGFSMYLLGLTLFQKMENRNLAALFAAFFYMFNSYFMFFKMPDRAQSLFSYMIMPLALGLYIKGLEKRNNLLFSIGIAFVFLFMAPAVTTPTYLLIVCLVLFLYFLFYNLTSYSFTKLKRSVLFSAKASFFIVLFNMWWFLPYCYNIFFTDAGSESFKIAKDIGSFQNTFQLNSSETSFLNIFRIMGYWALDAKDQGLFYYPFLSKVYNSLIFICISIFIPIIVFSSYLIKNIDQRKKKIVLFFGILSIVSLLFIKGLHEPFSDFNKSVFFNVPFFSMFRSQYEKLGAVLVLSYSALFGFTISSIYSFFKNKRILSNSYLIIVFSVFFIIHMFPLWTGHNIREKVGHLKSQRVAIPNEYQNTYDWLKKLFLEKRLLIYPLSLNEYGNIEHQWQGVNGNILSKLLNQAVITRVFFDKKNDLNNNLNLLVGLLPFLNVQYIFIDDTRDPFTYDKKNIKQIDQCILNRALLPINEFGQLKFYKIRDDNFLQHFYTPQTILRSSANAEDLPTIVSQLNDIRPVIFFEEQNRGKSLNGILLRSGLRNNTPVLEFKKINPTKYIVRVHQAEYSFPLVFSESFHKGWKVYPVKLKSSTAEQIRHKAYKSHSSMVNVEDYKILELNGGDQATKKELITFIKKGWVSALKNENEKKISFEEYKIGFISKNFNNTIQNNNLPSGQFYETFFKKSVDEKDHLIANGYANSWWIKIDDIKKSGNYIQNPNGSIDFELVIEYWPQRLFYFGFFISMTILLFFLVYLSCYLKKVVVLKCSSQYTFLRHKNS